MEWSGEVDAVFTSADLSTELSCTFSASAGAGAVPAAALARLTSEEAYLDVEVRSINVLRQDTWQVQLKATTHALVGEGAAAVGSTLLQ